MIAWCSQHIIASLDNLKERSQRINLKLTNKSINEFTNQATNQPMTNATHCTYTWTLSW